MRIKNKKKARKLTSKIINHATEYLFFYAYYLNKLGWNEFSFLFGIENTALENNK